jgi:hypothetical protein
MKKFFCFSGLILLFALSVYSQEVSNSKLVNKKGSIIQPEQGDWCIGIDATPFINYIGNLIKLTSVSNNAPTFGFTAQNPGIFWGKYMISDVKAYRFSITIGVTMDVQKEPNVRNNNLTNTVTNSALAIGFTFGIENYRPLKSRLIGIYGFEGGLFLKPYFGPTRNSSGFVTGRLTFEDASLNTNNYTESGGNTISLLGRGFVGIEYIFAPKMSLSGEFGLDLSAYYKGERKYVPQTGSNEIIDASGYGFNLAPSASGSLVLRFYF